MRTDDIEKIFYVKAYRKKDLIKELRLSSEYIFEKITKPHEEKIGKRMGHYYTPKQVGIIFELFQAYKKANSIKE